MMDIYCPVCREPWDNDELHFVAEERGTSYKDVAADFRRRGCEALNSRHFCQICGEDETFCSDPKQHLKRDEFVDAVYDLLGDDMDGAASTFDDLWR